MRIFDGGALVLLPRRSFEYLQALSAPRRRGLEVMTMMGPLVEKLAAEGDCLATYLIDELDKAHVAMQSENVAVAAYMAGSERRQRTPVGICALVELGV